MDHDEQHPVPSLRYSPFKLTKLGARVGVTAMFSVLGGDLASYYAPRELRRVAFAICAAISAVLYWRLWSWVMRLRRKS